MFVETDIGLKIRHKLLIKMEMGLNCNSITKCLCDPRQVMKQ